MEDVTGKGSKKSGYDRADRCNTLMLRLERKEDDVLKVKKTRTDKEYKEEHTKRMGSQC